MSDPERPPATPGPRSLLLQAAGGGALIAVIVGLVVLLVPGGPPPPYQGVPPSPAALAAAVSACDWMADLNKPPLFTETPVLTDTSGKFVAAVFVSPKRVVRGCFSDGVRNSTVNSMNSVQLSLYAAPGPEQLGLPASGAGSGVEQGGFGLVGSSVEAVTFVFQDGSTSKAAIQNGWYFAWWPDGTPASVRVRTALGTITSAMVGPGSGCRPGTSSCVFAGFNNKLIRQTQRASRARTTPSTSSFAEAPGPPTATIGPATTSGTVTTTLTTKTGSG